MNFSRIDWTAPAAKIVKAVAGEASREETACGSGKMVWHCWKGPPDQTPLVFLHGGWGSWTHWIKVILPLASKRTIYVADLPGMGDSADAPKPHTSESLSNIIADGVEVLLSKDQEYHAICFSFGGVLGAWMAVRHGQRCRSLTLVGAAGFGGLHFVVEGIRIPDRTLSDLEIDLVHHENLKLLMFSDVDRIDALALYVHRHNIARGRVRSRRISLSEGLIEALPNIKSSIGGIWGSDDATGGGSKDILSREGIIRSYQPNCKFDIIEGAGHWVMYEAADQFCEILETHLASYEKIVSIT